jgi:undecaprenyl-diphosphatase
VNLAQSVLLFIGLAQWIALVPGVSRSGATISAGLLSGLDRFSAARLSFLQRVVASHKITAFVPYRVLLGGAVVMGVVATS